MSINQAVNEILYEEDLSESKVLLCKEQDLEPILRVQRKNGLTAFEASLALLSTIVGGGIVGLPYAIYRCGIPLGIFINVLLAISTYYSFILYMNAARQIPVTVQSLYEIGFVSMGRSSIYLITVLQLFGSFGLMLIYFITFGDTIASIVFQLGYHQDKENFLTTRLCWAGALGIVLLPVVMMKEIKELKAISVILFVSLGIFVLMFIIQICGGYSENPDEDFSYYWQTQWDQELVTAFSIVLVAYSCQQNIFPMYVSLKKQTLPEAKVAMGISLGMSFGIYVILALISVYMFGSTIDESVLDNIDEETNVPSYIIRFSFSLVLACHIPYIFYSGKESLCIIVDEIMRGQMTKALEASLSRATNIDLRNEDSDEDQKQVELMAYKEMIPCLYYGLTIALYTAEIIVSILMPSIGVIFNFISAFTLSGLAFIFPGLFYYLCQRKFQTFYDKTLQCLSIAYIFFGVLSGTLIFVSTCMEL